MTAPIPGATDPNSLANYISAVDPSNTSKQDPTLKVNNQGQLDVYGLGDLSGQPFPLGTNQPVPTGQMRRLPGGDMVNAEPLNNDNSNLQGTTTDDYVKTLAALSQTNPDEYEQIQIGLWKAGYYGNTAKPSDIGLGKWNQTTRDALYGANGALRDYLQLYQTGATMDTFTEFLQKQSDLSANDPYSPANNASGSNSNQRPLTNAAQIDQQADAMSQSLLGRATDTTEQDAIEGDVHGQEISALNAGDVYLRSVTPASVAREYILNNNLPEYAQHQAEGFMNAFVNSILGSGARPNTGVGDAAVPTTAPGATSGA